MARPYRVAIVGSGVAGAAAATWLAEAGAEVTLFDDGKRPPLVVGESLVPALVPLLARLGLEEAVAALGVHKPGVTFWWGPDDVYRFDFSRFARGFPPYAYNVPRPAFDQLILDRAHRAGVRIVAHRAHLVVPTADHIALDDAARAAGGFDLDPPDFVIDATGRTRQVARLLDLPTHAGSRDDVAHFAHYSGFDWDQPPGQVLISRLARGWSWRIPLRDRLSVGIVLDRAAAAALGDTPEARLQAVIASDPALAQAGRHAERLTPVVTYSNYQLTTARGHGPGWALVGDAFGFVDPMLSPGVFLAMWSADQLARALTPAIRHGLPPKPALDRYAAKFHHVLTAWTELIESIYGGTLFGLYHVGTAMVRTHPSLFTRGMERHIGRNVAGMATGARTTSRYSRGLIRFLAKHSFSEVNPHDFAVR